MEQLTPLAVQRLSTLANFMDNLKLGFRQEFDMTKWRTDKTLCGTVCCAAGWGAHVPEFLALGYRVENKQWSAGIPYFAGETDWMAVKKFFDVTQEQGAKLFDKSLADVIKTPKQWADHCRTFIRENTAADAFKAFMAKAQEPVKLPS